MLNLSRRGKFLSAFTLALCMFAATYVPGEGFPQQTTKITNPRLEPNFSSGRVNPIKYGRIVTYKESIGSKHLSKIFRIA